MGESTKIAWTDHTFNPWWGCQRLSPACEKCYAETFAKRTGHDIWGPKSERRFFGDKHWNEPLKWNAAAEKAGERRRVFCASMSDVFEDRPDLVVHRERLWGLIETTPGLDWLLLTKRPENMARMTPTSWSGRWPQNAWAGTTVESQRYADERMPLLLNVPAPVRFLSCEPLLECVDLRTARHWRRCRACAGAGTCGVCARGEVPVQALDVIDWVIVGGESGPGARTCEAAWIRDIVRQCRAAGTAAFVKQLGAHYVDAENGIGGVQAKRPEPGLVTIRKLRDPKGGDIAEFPEDLRIREFPDGSRAPT